MQSLVFLGASAFTVMATAMPTHFDSVTRSCSISLPSSYQQISESALSQVFPQNRYFQASQARGGVGEIDSLVLFTNIPTGSYGCQLGAEFTYEYPIQSSGSTKLNVYALPSTIQPTDTYLTYFPSGKRAIPSGAYLFGTTTLDGTRVVINGAVCEQTMSFLFEIESDTEDGLVGFTDAGDNLTGIGGLYMTYNC